MTSAVAKGSLHLAAAYDEDAPAWQDFYPDDLPEDWRLAYYAHYWRNILIPASAWARFTTNTDWVTEVPDTLRMYFEIPVDEVPTSDVLVRLSSLLGPRLGGVLDAGERESPAQTLLQGRWFVPVPAPEVAGVDDAAAFATRGAMVLWLRPVPGLSLPGWRALLEQIHTSADGSASMLVFLQVGPRELEAAETILRLGGLQQLRRKD